MSYYFTRSVIIIRIQRHDNNNIRIDVVLADVRDDVVQQSLRLGLCPPFDKVVCRCLRRAFSQSRTQTGRNPRRESGSAECAVRAQVDNTIIMNEI